MLLLRALNPRNATLFRLFGLVLIGWTVFSSEPAPATSGRGLVVLVLFVLGTSAWLAWTAWTSRMSRMTPDLYVLAVCGGVLASANNGAGSAFCFIAAMVASVRVSLVHGLVVAAVGACGVAASSIEYGGSGIGVLAYTLGFCAMALAGANLRQTELRAEQAELLLAQSQRSHEEQLRAARLEESTRIARDIHDVLAHSLAGLAIQLQATDALLAQGAEVGAVRARVQRAHELAREGLNETRRAVGALRGDAPEPVAVRLQQLVADHNAVADVSAEIEIAGQLDGVSGAVAEAVFRTVQEALTNARKHAPGALVRVSVRASDGDLIVAVEDDAAELTLVPAPHSLSQSGGGFGLVGMRERAEQLGGELETGFTGRGWRVRLKVPIGGQG
jgi:signal transduction histidine kinase